MSFSINSFHSQIVIFNIALWGTLTGNRVNYMKMKICSSEGNNYMKRANTFVTFPEGNLRDTF